MRYEDWDVLLFPADVPVDHSGNAPLKEFRVGCHVVVDAELSPLHGTCGVPVMACFVPSLPAGAPFQISIHNWRETPELSQFSQGYSKHAECVKFEARILVDGQIIAAATFDRKSNWPHLITNTFYFAKNGILELLKFPTFQREILYQTHWGPDDDMGRIKIILSESFPRDSQSAPLERVKNVAVFSFQHAPLELLENNGIAWPNPSIRRQLSLLNNTNVPVPTYHPEDGPNYHSHSPRRRPSARDNTGQSIPVPFEPWNSQSAAFTNNPIFTQNMSMFQRQSAGSGCFNPDGFVSTEAYPQWPSIMEHAQALGLHNPYLFHARKLRPYSSTDTSMPDYVPPNGTYCHGNDPMQLSGGSLDDDTAMAHPKVPTNTPTGGYDEASSDSSTLLPPNCAIPAELAWSLTHSLLNQPAQPPALQPHQIPLPASEVKSRKENRCMKACNTNPSPGTTASPTDHALETRKFSQPAVNLTGAGITTGTTRSCFQARDSPLSQPCFSASASRSASAGEFDANITNCRVPSPADTSTTLSAAGSEKGLKRSRNVTPASAKAIDDDGEPRRVSPHLRAAATARAAAGN